MNATPENTPRVPVPIEDLRTVHDYARQFDVGDDESMIRVGEILEQPAPEPGSRCVTCHDQIITETGQEMAGGGYQLMHTTPELEEIWPLARQIAAGHRSGRVYARRRIIVIEDWTELPRDPI